MSREGSREIEDRAALWAARLERGPLSAADQSALDGWLAGDPRRLGAFARARAVALHSLRAAALKGLPTDGRFNGADVPVSSRRSLIAASAAVLTVGGAGLLAAHWRRSQAFETGLGEIETVPLSDGSTMTLSTLSRASVRYGREVREVVFTAGEVLFSVVPSDRPFVVSAAGSRILATSGRFLVRRMDLSPVQVLALDTSVRVLRRGGAAISVSPLYEAALSDDEIAVQQVDESEAGRALAWRHGKVAFQDTPLAEAAREFARFSGRRIVIADPAVRDMKITGLFPANDPIVFARAAAVSLNLRVVLAGDLINLSRA